MMQWALKNNHFRTSSNFCNNYLTAHKIYK